MEVLREGLELTAKEKAIHQQGLVGVFKELHDELDTAVLQAYGWSDMLRLPASEHSKDELLTRLVALNSRRAAEEANGTIRWLRPEFQNPQKPLSKAERLMQVQKALGDAFDIETAIGAGQLGSEPSPISQSPWPGPLPCPSKCAPWPRYWPAAALH
jgi:hypothetical protein